MVLPSTPGAAGAAAGSDWAARGAAEAGPLLEAGAGMDATAGLFEPVKTRGSSSGRPCVPSKLSLWAF